ncbi:NADH dehydrogenase (quinone) subunit D [soil metagenome]
MVPVTDIRQGPVADEEVELRDEEDERRRAAAAKGRASRTPPHLESEEARHAGSVTMHTSPAHGRDIVARTEAEVIGQSPVERTAAGETVEPEQELMTINMGPHHPATHGVLRLLVSLQGEVVKDLKPIMGYVHTGIEKSCEDKSYWKVIPFVERMDYLSYFFNMQAFCGAVEKLLELEIPRRAQYLRVIHLELNRLHSHLVWLGTSALDLGAMSMFFYCFRDRDRILDLFEMSAGQRMHTRYFQVGGVAEDIPMGFEQRVLDFCDEFPSRIDQFEALLTNNEIFLQRTKGIGVVSRERLLALGVTGPLLRAAGEPWDLRKVAPYLSYADHDFDIPIGTVGDGWDRFRCRIQEMRESVKIIRQAVEGLPDGPWIADDRKIVLPPRHELSTSMEALIHHFKLVTEGFRVPPGETYHPIESPRGELGCFVVADGSAKPARVHFRDPSFVNLQALKDMCVGEYVADLIQTLAMLDPILGGIDR